jgi:hypothetical protein
MYSIDNGVSFTSVSPASTTSPIVINGLTNGTNYSVIIRAVNAFGNGENSNVTEGSPVAPNNPTLTTTIPVIYITQTIGQQLIDDLGLGTVTSNINSILPKQYFIIGTDNITIDGQNNIVEINGLQYYPGLIQNGTDLTNGYD